MMITPLLGLLFAATPAQLLDQGLAALDRGDTAAARESLTPLADRGSPIAEMLIGNTYLGTDSATAATYFFHAAERGYPPAQVAFARLLAKGEGVRRDDRAAYQWALVAAARDSAVVRHEARALANEVGKRLSPEDRRKAATNARNWRVRAASGN